MKKTRVGKWIAATGASLMFLFAFIFSVGGGILPESLNDGEKEQITASASVAVTYPNGENDLGCFPNGYSYVYTDKNKITNLRSRVSDTDLTTVTVDSSVSAGNQQNPYVIATTADWEKFAKKVITTGSNGLNQYFVLANDLDFSGIAFHPVYYFRGTFYGMGHSLKNISVSTWQSYVSNTTLTNMTSSSYGYGVFGGMSGATVTDLIVEDYVYSNMPELSDTTLLRRLRVGGIVGYSGGADFILNCHASGEITSTTTYSGTNYLGIGGIVGVHSGGSTAIVTVYRCSAEMKSVVLKCKTYCAIIGGIIGDLAAQSYATIYDCVVNVKSNNSGGNSVFPSLTIGWMQSVPASNLIIENVVGTVTESATKPVYGGGLVSLCNGSTAPTLRNLFGEIRSGGKIVYAAIGNSKPAATLATISNLHIVKSPTDSYVTSFVSGQGNAASNLTAKITVHDSGSDMVQSAKDSVGSNSSKPFNSNIWDVSKIGGTYDPDNSPVRNYLITTVSYFNCTASGDNQYSVNGSMEPQIVEPNQVLFEPEFDTETRIFLGWTTDKTGASEPFKALPNVIHGDNKLYAVWGAKTSSVSVSVSGTGMTGDDTNGYSLVYNGEGRGIALTADLSVDGMSDPQITYQWAKGTDKLGTAKTCKVENVRDSGNYSVTLEFHSGNEPLFRGEAVSKEIQVTINPAPLTCRGVTFSDDARPYSGAPYDTAVPTANVFDKDGLRVNGTTAWAVDLGKFNDTDGNAENITDGKETKQIAFTPAEEYGGNYGEFVNFDVTFEIEYLKFIFSIPRINNLKLEVSLEYGQHYTYNNVVTMFEEVFAPYLGTLAGNTPAFMVDNKAVKINDYRQLGAQGGSTTAYGNVKQSYTIDVTFVPQSYTVTYDARNQGTNTYDPVTVGHGIRLPKPVDPVYGNQMFLGWFYEFTDDDGQKSERAWNFDADRVTREMKLYAKWLQADTLKDLIVTPSPLIRYIAKQQIDPSMLTVKAVFEGTAEGQTLTQEAVLTSGQYTISYENGASVLHAKEDDSATTAITISYTFKPGETKTVTLDVKVEKIPVDTQQLRRYFKDTAVVVTGEPQTIAPIRAQDIERLFPEELSGCEVSYKYYNSQEQEIDPNDVQRVGVYYVRAYFKPVDADYDAPYIQARFQIVNEKIKLTVDWGNTEFTYNGKAQAPVPTFTDGDGNVVIANYSLKLTRGTEEITEAIKARSDYIAELTLEDLAYELEGSMSIPFSIATAVLPVPTQIKPFPYSGFEYDLNTLNATDCEMYFEGFDLSFMTVRSGEGIRGDKGKDASRYNATIELNDPDSARFENGSNRATMSWQIEKAKLTVDWSQYEFYANNGIQTPKVNLFYEFYGTDADLVDYATDIEYSGDINAMTDGEYRITVIVKPEAAWFKNYELDETKTCSFYILPKAGMEVISIVWDTNTLFEYNGGVQRPAFKVLNRVGADITDQIPSSEFRWNEDAQTSKWEGDYSAEVTMRPGSNYFLTGSTSCLYTITKNANGEGAKPGESGNNPEGPGTVIPGPSENTNELPLWQLIVGGVSALLFVVCSAKAFGEYGKYKAAKKEAKELAQVSYSVTYGFAPLPLMAIALWGLGETPWTIIAFVALGLFLISLAAMLLLSKKRKAAELAVRREQARIDEEKEYARQEEQLRREEQLRAEQQMRDDQMREEQMRRDNEFKMMFAAMQQNYQQPQFGYDDMQNLIASTVTALLPGLQQTMQALPPAQSPEQYATPAPAPAPDQYGAPAQYAAPAPNQYAAPAAPQYAAPSPETDALRAQLAQQQAQMAQQQELINQLLQNQQAQQAAPAAPQYAAPEPAPAYDGYAASAQEEAFWTVEGEEIVSLEELYGKLSDDAKRGYYEIGSYIMNKPQTSQNDGKYAVLFKYRGKTLFKLCIKNDAPVLYYPADNGGRAELLIVDAAALQVAKSIVDVHIAKTDSEMA